VKITGVAMVRNERDLVGVTVAHHLAAGVDEVLIVDNGSTDGTPDVLRLLAKNGRVHWLSDTSAYRQASITTALAREAYDRGADWVLPFDADEFWVGAVGDLRAPLERTEAGTLAVQIRNFVQDRECRDAKDPESLLTMTHRVVEPPGSWERSRELVESGAIGFVEMAYPPKYVTRAGPEIRIGPGNHEVGGYVGERLETDEVLCYHAPLRNAASLLAKAEQGDRVDEAGWPQGLSWHVRRFRRLHEEGALEDEWAANSAADGTLDVFGTRRPLVEDTSLREAVARWVPATAV
jgi:glycosyltransferase involved in cell wall biosynthesis